MKTRILGYSKDKKTARVRFEKDDFSMVKSINCGFENGAFSSELTKKIINAHAVSIENKIALGVF